MTQKRREGGRGALVGLTVVILGSLLFAAGVMVGRQQKIQEPSVPKNILEQIDQRDSKLNQIDTDGLTFHEELNKPSKIRQESKSTPEPTTEATPKPTPKPIQQKVMEKTPTPTPAPALDKKLERKIELQVASFSEPKMAEQLKDKLKELGFGSSKVVEGDVEGKTYFRVRLGPYLDRQAATQDIEALRDHGLNAMIFED